MRYGLPYQGSKNKIAEKIIAEIPPAEHFIDLFAGGCAITHCALLSGKYKHVHANDITDSVKLFDDALNGDLAKYEPERFRSREDFFAEKDTNPFVRNVYSFSNDQKTYLYGKEIEPYKRAVHEMIYAPTPNERRLKFKAVIREMEKLGVLNVSSASTPPYVRKQDVAISEHRGSGKSEGNYPPPNNQSTDGLSEHRSNRADYGRLQSQERTEQIESICD